MRKKIIKEMEVEVSTCNICGLEIDKDPFNKERIKIVRHLFNTIDFDAHENCINKVVKEAFNQYVSPLSEKIKNI